MASSSPINANKTSPIRTDQKSTSNLKNTPTMSSLFTAIKNSFIGKSFAYLKSQNFTKNISFSKFVTFMHLSKTKNNSSAKTKSTQSNNQNNTSRSMKLQENFHRDKLTGAKRNLPSAPTDDQEETEFASSAELRKQMEKYDIAESTDEYNLDDIEEVLDEVTDIQEMSEEEEMGEIESVGYETLENINKKPNKTIDNTKQKSEAATDNIDKTTGYNPDAKAETAQTEMPGYASLAEIKKLKKENKNELGGINKESEYATLSNTRKKPAPTEKELVEAEYSTANSINKEVKAAKRAKDVAESATIDSVDKIKKKLKSKLG